MRTIIVIGVVAVIAFFSLRSVVKMLKGESGCGCSKDSNCAMKDHCSSKDKNKK
ncbi:FeoB-associated Cys-rich membrane protein [Ilyobacter sp.]|jgi:hypothetical protein|uniref:FeoB-associated Cys-rich membrane protein n=1 Tax=Ilyobacter sp. TaxID=3100343 RepID=UPI0035636BCD